MMHALGRFTVKVADLVEAEGRAARREVWRLVEMVLVGITAMVLFLTGIAAVGGGAYLALIMLMPPAAALTLVGAALLAGALVALRLIHRFSDRVETRHYHHDSHAA
ncbi:MAG: hypothetical protein GC162_04270 [Planctomycetes bacterium]|nr:hypothetical protein [Planctomycetota bacterium]